MHHNLCCISYARSLYDIPKVKNIVKANKNSRLIEKSNRNEKHIRSLLAGTEYTFEIRAIDKNNEESIPYEKKFSTAVPPPRQVSFSNEAETSITIRLNYDTV